jgi:hypothetical protein
MSDYTGGQSAARVLSPEAFCFILDTDSGERVEFQLMPESISESKSAMYNEVPIIGRSLPLLGYANSSARTMGIGLSFAALFAEGKYSPSWVEEQVRWLESKVYPIYEDGYVFPPPRLLVVVGKAIGLQCIMNSVNTTWLGPWSVANQDAYAFRAQVDIQFQEYGMNEDAAGHPFDADDAKEGKNQSFERGGGTFYVDIPTGV